MKSYNPLTKKEQQRKADVIAQKFCSKCNGDYETGCKECIWYLLMNSTIDEIPW